MKDLNYLLIIMELLVEVPLLVVLEFLTSVKCSVCLEKFPSLKWKLLAFGTHCNAKCNADKHLQKLILHRMIWILIDSFCIE